MEDISLRDEEQDAEREPLLIKPKDSLNTGALTGVLGLQRLRAAYGSDLLWLIIGGMWVIKGFGGAIEGLASPFMLKEYHVPAAQGQVYQALIGLPWSLKPILGLLSDTYPIGGYNKFPYAAMASASGLTASVAIAMTSTESMPLGVFVCCLFLCVAYMANISVLVQGSYSARLQESGDEQSRSYLVSFEQGGVCFCGTIGAVLVGFMIHMCGPRKALFMFAAPAGVASVFVLKSYLKEKRKSAEEIKLCRERCAKQSEILVLAILLFLANVATMVTGMSTDNPVINGAVAVTMAMTMAGAVALLLSPTAAGIVCYLIIVCTVGYEHDGAKLYFCTDTKVQYPNGPHLSQLFYTSARLPANAVFSIIGILVFANVSKGWTYRRWYSAVLFVMVFTQLPLVMFYGRMNVAWGIADSLWLLFAEGFDNVACMWVLLPAITAFATLCPQGAEATVFGLLMSMLNLATSASNSLGGLVLYSSGVNPSGVPNESAQFDRLWILVALKPAISWAVSCLLLWTLPDKVIGASLIDAESSSITSGSLWKRWRGSCTLDGQRV